MNKITCRLKAVTLGLIVFAALNSYGALWCATVKALSPSDFPIIDLTQTANIKVVFLGVLSDYVDEINFLSRISRSVNQFAYPNNMTWHLNLTIVFHEFPAEVVNSLIDDAYHFEGTTYYNITLLDTLLSQFEYLAVPEHGYLIIFMRIPDSEVNHSWFYIQEGPDLFLGRTDFFDGKPSTYWTFPHYFGGMHGVLYFDLSDVIEKTPMKTVITDTATRLFNNSLADMFVNLLEQQIHEWSQLMCSDMKIMKCKFCG